MFLLQAKEIAKQYGSRMVLDFPLLSVYEGDRIGIVGVNGSGKTTLLRILSGDLQPDSGQVVRRCEPALIRQLPKREGTLSGGENAKALIQQETLWNDSVILADEPTANLDEAGIEWVRGKLLRAETVVVVSHDRALLDAVCNRIVEIRDGKLHFYTGDYGDYLRQVEEEKRRQQLEYETVKKKKEQLEQAIEGRQQQVARQRQKKRREYATNLSEAKLGGHKRAASMKKQERLAKVLESRLERLPQVEKVKELPKIHLDFSLTHPPGNKLVIRCAELTFAYGDKTVLSGASFEVANGSRTAVTGSNGAGKTTLLRLIYEGHDAISKVPKLKLGYLHQSFEDLDPAASILDNVMRNSVQSQETARGVLAGLLFRRDEVFKPVSVLSGGEKMRVSLARLVVSDCNGLLLDEPTNYLDIRSLEAVERVLKEYPGTLLAVSHDRSFLDRVTDGELRIDNRKVLRPQAVVAAPSPVNKALLEIRRIQLLGEISRANPEQKTALEAEFNQVTRQLQQLASS